MNIDDLLFCLGTPCDYCSKGYSGFCLIACDESVPVQMFDVSVDMIIKGDYYG